MVHNDPVLQLDTHNHHDFGHNDQGHYGYYGHLSVMAIMAKPKMAINILGYLQQSKSINDINNLQNISSENMNLFKDYGQFKFSNIYQA